MINEIISKTIQDSISEYDKNAAWDKMYVGVIQEVINATTYIVKYDNASRKLKTKNVLGLNCGDIIHIVYPMSNKYHKFILEDLVKIQGSSGEGSVDSVNGYTGIVNLDSDYYKKSKVYTKTEVDTFINGIHTHDNKTVLDGITSVLIDAWNLAVTHITDTVKHITDSERNLWNTVSNKVDKVNGKMLTSNDLTNELKTNYDVAYEYSTASHAPVNAEHNIIIGVQKNGVNIVPDDSRNVNMIVPTKVSELENDSGYKTTDTIYTHPDMTQEDTTSTITPSSGETFTVIDSVTTNQQGHVSGVNLKTVTLPSTSIIVDSALSNTSANPVQNKIVKSELDKMVYISSIEPKDVRENTIWIE